MRNAWELLDELVPILHAYYNGVCQLQKTRICTSMIQTLRLDDDLNSLVASTAKALGSTRSEVIRSAIDQYCRQVLAESKNSIFDKIVSSGFGPLAVGPGDLSTNKKRLKARIRERHKTGHR
jgi:hypothetical protein